MHTLHDVAPMASWYDPPAHAAQLSLIAIDASVYVPFAHRVSYILPVAEKEPALTGVQSPDATLLVALVKDPPAHGSGVELPLGQKFPTGHAMGRVVAADGQ